MRINSEITTLKKVILHRPNLSLRRLTPKNCASLLFDDVLWVDKANEEHLAFSKALESYGVSVYLLHDLMSESLENVQARQWLLQRILDHIVLSQSTRQAIYQYLDHLDAKSLATYLLGGLTLHEITNLGLRDHLQAHNFRDDFILSPLPNHLFARDTACWIDQGVSINPMHFPARQRETLNIATIYKFHPLFQKNQFTVWYDGSDVSQNLPSIEGGDVLVICKDCIVIGLSQRTTLQAVILLAKALFAKSQVKKIIALDIPKMRTFMHLDTMMTMIDHATFCIANPQDKLRAWSITPGAQPHELAINQEKDFFQAVAKALGEKKLNLITLAGDIFTQQREQWNDATNILVIAPGVLVVYDRNVEMNRKLRKAGLELVEIPGSELSRGRGGPRCMSCPIERA